MRFLMVGILLLSLMFIGCGASKDFVLEQIAQSEAQTKANVDAVDAKTVANATEITSLKSLADQLAEKTDMAINEAKGFETYQVIWQGEINYDFDSYTLTAAAEEVLNEAGAKLEQHPEAVVEIAGYTDQTGSADYNMELGEKRAGSAKLFLADRFGISLYRLFVVSYGESKPVAGDSENMESSKNRRVTVKVWGKL